MSIEQMLLCAIDKKEMIKFLRGEEEYLVETSQYAPCAEITDVGAVLSKGIYSVYADDNSIKQKFEENLLQMLDYSDFDVYIVCLYLSRQLFKEKNGLSPFKMSKDIIIERLKTRLNEREKDIKSGIEYPNGFVNKFAMQEIERARLVCKEEYGVLF